ncbi:hypothetical protein [Marinobacter sp. W-8]|uniref:hypothetical protein n=1 Tax=Marinobacter sp. W-8 TaxID=3369658 RepID=UPI0037CBC9BB
MSGKFLARASALSLAVLLAACGGDDDSTPIVNVNPPSNPDSTPGETDTGTGTTNPDDGTTTPGEETPQILALLGNGTGSSFSEGQLFSTTPTIPSGGSHSFDLTIADPETKEPWLKSGQSISYASPCIDAGLASIEGPTTAASGIIKARYVSSGCYDTDLVHAFVEDSPTPAASGAVTIEPPETLELALTDYNPVTESFSSVNTILSTSTSIAKNGQARLTVGIVDVNNGNSLQNGIPFTVNFESFCAGGENNSQFEPASVSTTSGIAETIFTAGSCTQNPQKITATLESESGQLVPKATIEIAVDETQAFQLVAALPDPMSIAPSTLSEEGRETAATVSFTLKDQTGEPLKFEDVTFTIDRPGTADFIEQGTGSIVNSVTANTGNDGVATAQVRAKEGVDHEEFRVIATFGDLMTYTQPIVVNSLLPYQPKFSLSAENFAPDTWGVNGVQSNLTLYVADINGNRIRGNVYVNFQTDQGSIDPDCVVTDGRCTVTWESLLTDAPYANITASTHGRITTTQIGTISSTTTLLMSTNDNVFLELSRKGAQEITGTEYCATAWVQLPGEGSSKFSPPVGTTINFAVDTGEAVQGAVTSKTIGSTGSLVFDSDGYEVCTKIKPEADETVTPTVYTIELTATVQTPGEGAAETEIIAETW